MKTEKFHSPANRGLGVVGLVLGVLIVVGVAQHGVDGGEYVALPAMGLAMTACWAALVRPVILLDERTLTLRRQLSTVIVPVGEVTRVEVHRYTFVEVGDDQRLTSTAVSRSFWQAARADRRELAGSSASDEGDYATYMCQRIEARAEENRGVGGGSAGIRRTPAWPEITLLAVFAVAAIVASLVV